MNYQDIIDDCRSQEGCIGCRWNVGECPECPECGGVVISDEDEFTGCLAEVDSTVPNQWPVEKTTLFDLPPFINQHRMEIMGLLRKRKGMA